MFQRIAVKHALTRNTIIDLPTGTGKTMVAGLVIDAFLRSANNMKAVFVVNQVLLVTQQAPVLATHIGSDLKIGRYSSKETALEFWYSRIIL